MAFEAQIETKESEIAITLHGDLDSRSASVFRDRLEAIESDGIERLVLDLSELTYLSSAGVRELVFVRQKMDDAVEVVVVGASDVVVETIRLTGFDRSVTMVGRAGGQ